MAAVRTFGMEIGQCRKNGLIGDMGKRNICEDMTLSSHSDYMTLSDHNGEHISLNNKQCSSKENIPESLYVLYTIKHFREAMPSSAHNDQYISLNKYNIRGLPSSTYSEVCH